MSAGRHGQAKLTPYAFRSAFSSGKLRLLLPGKLVEGKFVPNHEGKGPLYRVQYSAVTATVDNGAARAKIEETIAGPEQAVDMVCLIPLPEGVDGREAVVLAGVPSGVHEPLPAARFLGPAEAQRIYEAVARGLDNVTILALSGRPALIISEFRLQGKVEIVVEFRQNVRQQGGLCRLECPMPVTSFAGGHVARLSVSVTIAGEEPLRAIFSPTHATNVDRNGPCKAVARVKCDNYAGTDDLRLLWVADKDDLGLRVLACKPDADEDGYFLLVGNPASSARAEQVAKKDVTFVLDTSGSMRGEKIEHARAAIDYCLGQLDAGDRFNIVAFGTEVVSFRNAPFAASQANVAAAREFIDNLVATGETNVSGALAKALGGERTNRSPIVIFLKSSAKASVFARSPIISKIFTVVSSSWTSERANVSDNGH